MNTNKKIAIIAGVLFIIATVASLLSLPFIAPINASNYLVDVSANGNQVIIGALFLFISAAASAGIAISLYPILKNIIKVWLLDLLVSGLLRECSVLLV
jgi:hypothetical protein